MSFGFVWNIHKTHGLVPVVLLFLKRWNVRIFAFSTLSLSDFSGSLPAFKNVVSHVLQYHYYKGTALFNSSVTYFIYKKKSSWKTYFQLVQSCLHPAFWPQTQLLYSLFTYTPLVKYGTLNFDLPTFKCIISRNNDL